MAYRYDGQLFFDEMEDYLADIKELMEAKQEELSLMIKCFEQLEQVDSETPRTVKTPAGNRIELAFDSAFEPSYFISYEHFGEGKWETLGVLEQLCKREKQQGEKEKFVYDEYLQNFKQAMEKHLEETSLIIKCFEHLKQVDSKGRPHLVMTPNGIRFSLQLDRGRPWKMFEEDTYDCDFHGRKKEILKELSHIAVQLKQ